jgi:hypothetical protein
MCIWMFSIILSHFKELHEFFMCALTIVGEISFIFSFVWYGLVRKSLGVGCTFEKMAQKTKCQKMNVNIFIIKLGWIISPGQNPFKLLYSIMILNTTSLPCKAGPTNLFLRCLWGRSEKPIVHFSYARYVLKIQACLYSLGLSSRLWIKTYTIETWPFFV